MEKNEETLRPLMVWIPPKLKREFKQKVLDQDTTIKNVIISFLEAYVDKKKGNSKDSSSTSA